MSFKSLLYGIALLVASVTASSAVTAPVTIGVDGQPAVPITVNVPQGDTSLVLQVFTNSGTTIVSAGSFQLNFDSSVLTLTNAIIDPGGTLGLFPIFELNPFVFLDTTAPVGFDGLVQVAELEFTIDDPTPPGLETNILAAAGPFPFLAPGGQSPLSALFPSATLNFTAEPIPLPASAWMMLGALALGGVLARKRTQRSA